MRRLVPTRSPADRQQRPRKALLQESGQNRRFSRHRHPRPVLSDGKLRENDDGLGDDSVSEARGAADFGISDAALHRISVHDVFQDFLREDSADPQGKPPPR